MTNLQKWVEQYLTACKYQKALDTKTIKAYRIDLSQFSLFAGQGDERKEINRLVLQIALVLIQHLHVLIIHEGFQHKSIL